MFIIFWFDTCTGTNISCTFIVDSLIFNVSVPEQDPWSVHSLVFIRGMTGSGIAVVTTVVVGIAVVEVVDIEVVEVVDVEVVDVVDVVLLQLQQQLLHVRQQLLEEQQFE